MVTNLNDVKAPIVSIYPNPANDLLNIETSQPCQHFIEITSLNGQLLYTGRIEGPVHQIDFSCLRHWDTLAGFSQDFVWDFVRQLLVLSKTNTILANKGLESY